VKHIFKKWFDEISPEYPHVNLGGIRKILYKAYVDGFDLAYSRGYRAGYDDATKELEGEVVYTDGAPLNPTPEMLDAGGKRLIDWEVVTPEEKEQSRTDAERIWRVMWNSYKNMN
jgi:hypothetical protein